MSGLNLGGGGGGDFTAHVRYMASTSSWKMSMEGADNPPVEFAFDQPAIFDLEQIKTGWGVFEMGVAPEWVMDASLSDPAPKPTDGREWKRGFQFNIFSKNMFGEEPTREFATTGVGACMGVQALYSEFEKELPANHGKVPVVKFDGSVSSTAGRGSTTIPTLVIVKWVDRPADLPIETDAPAPAAAVQQQAAAPVENVNIDGDEEF